MKTYPGDFVLDPLGRRVPLHGPAAFASLRRAGGVAAACLDHITPLMQPGVTTASVDAAVAAFLRAEGAVPATLGYHGFPASCCISPNHVVNHGIPSDKVRLKAGDIVNVDVTAIVDGWYGDTSRMYLVGEVGAKPAHLVRTTYDGMMAGIAQVVPGRHLGDVGHAIEKVGKAVGYSTVRDYVGHGIGRVFHDAPDVMHFGKPGKGMMLVPGMVFTIEPMFNQGGPGVRTLPDGWTTITRDLSLSAQFEHTVGVTEDGVEIFTRSPAGMDCPVGAI
ncbi:type I methionyl aminopeptidase [Niveispirillum sp. KHB5.9]|uniref:type I methionyl aminopeptidase n=1 Tax=Niveispirillum sp. KHB5.9 TaxID=3400269 RepID=UPI003A86F3D6